MKMEQIECSETSAYIKSDAGDLPRRKHTITKIVVEYFISHNTESHIRGKPIRELLLN